MPRTGDTSMEKEVGLYQGLLACESSIPEIQVGVDHLENITFHWYIS